MSRFRPVLATFNGKHNKMKSLALITLLDNRQKGRSGLTLKELSRDSSVSYNYLKARLGKWHEWKYVRRRVTNGNSGPVYSYSIAIRGEAFVLTRIPANVLKQYIVELNEYHRKRIDLIRARLRARIAATR